jgi:hypothetical protein
LKTGETAIVEALENRDGECDFDSPFFTPEKGEKKSDAARRRISK